MALQASSITHDDEQRLLASVPHQLFIGGNWVDASDGGTFEVDDPATRGALKSIANATVADGQAALAAATAAQPGWAKTAPRDRAELLRAAFEAVTRRSDEFGLLMSLEMGKPFAEGKGEAAYGAEFLRWFSEETNRVAGRYATAPDGKNRILVLKRPVGPCLFVTPWNFPLAMATRKIAPALAAGCTVVLKPASLTPLTSLLFAKVLDELGLPAGVVNVIPTTASAAVTGPIISDPRLKKLSFTGSTEVGKKLIAQSAENVLRVSMELGGNAPFVVFEDADLDAAVEGAMVAKLRNMGEACVAANRFIVQESVADEFATRLAARMSALQVGRGADASTDIGPLIDQQSLDKVSTLVSEAVAGGATSSATVEVPTGGYFYPPTVLTNVSPDAEILREEIFGPVAPIVTFATEDEAVRLANASEFGLMAYVYTTDLNRGLRLSESIESGMIGLNTGLVSNPAAPFGGVKQSGLGREGGLEGIEEYLETVYVGIGDPGRR